MSDEGAGGFGCLLIVVGGPLYYLVPYGLWRAYLAIKDDLSTILNRALIVVLAIVAVGLVVMVVCVFVALVWRWALRPVAPRPPGPDEMNRYGAPLRSWEGSATSLDGRSETVRYEYDTKAENRATPEEAHAWEDVADRRLLREADVRAALRGDRDRERRVSRSRPPMRTTRPALPGGQPLPDPSAWSRQEPERRAPAPRPSDVPRE